MTLGILTICQTIENTLGSQFWKIIAKYRFADLSSIFLGVVPYLVHISMSVFFFFLRAHTLKNGEGNFENANFSLEGKQLDPLATKCNVCEVSQQHLYWAANKHFGSFYYNKHVQILTKQSFIAKDDTTYEYSQIRRHLIRDLLKWKKRHDGLSNLNNLDEHNWKGPLWGGFLLSGTGAHVWLFFTAPLVCLLHNVMSKNGGGCDRSVYNTRLGFFVSTNSVKRNDE